MNTPTSDTESQDFDAVLAIIHELAHKSDGNAYVYRGEPAIYPKISSGLYRRYQSIDDEGSHIQTIQEEIIAQARAHAPQLGDMEDFEILSHLQHNGGATNLIDFTTDYLVALFFACDGESGSPGRVILLAETGDGYYINKPTSPLHRVIAQKSVFVSPDKGFIAPNDEVVIDSHLKQPVLEYLRRHHGISTETIYNDIYGFIQHQDIHRLAYDELYKGAALADREDYRQAIQHYDEALTLNPRMATVYNHRGDAHYDLHEYDSAISDYERALKFDPEDYAVYHNLGLAYAERGNHRRAVECYDQAWELYPDEYTRYYRFESLLHLEQWEEAKQEVRFAALASVNISALLREHYEDISDFEDKAGLKLPDDIKELLGGRAERT